jgi:hypothetical protein
VHRGGRVVYTQLPVIRREMRPIYEQLGILLPQAATAEAERMAPNN